MEPRPANGGAVDRKNHPCNAYHILHPGQYLCRISGCTNIVRLEPIYVQRRTLVCKSPLLDTTTPANTSL